MSRRLKILTLTGSERLVTETCINCGVLFAMPEELYDTRQGDGGRFYCPNGHNMFYTGKTDAQKLKEAAARETALRDQLSAAIRDTEQTRRAMLRDRHRFANGVCPCCNRSFENVRRHIQGQHPEYDAAALGKPVQSYTCSCGSSFETLRGLHIHQGHARKDRAEAWEQEWDDPKTPDWAKHLTVVSG